MVTIDSTDYCSLLQMGRLIAATVTLSKRYKHIHKSLHPPDTIRKSEKAITCSYSLSRCRVRCRLPRLATHHVEQTTIYCCAVDHLDINLPLQYYVVPDLFNYACTSCYWHEAEGCKQHRVTDA